MILPPKYANMETLVVEKAPHLRRTVHQYLRQVGIHSVHEAEDAEAALTCIRRVRIELLIADWDILAENDEFLLQNIRNWASIRGRFAFVVMAGEAKESHVLHAINNGAESILLKPFSANCFWSHLGIAVKARSDRIASQQTARSA